MQCPTCEIDLTDHTAVRAEDGEDARPKNGDVSICIYCLDMHRFIDGGLVQVRGEERREIARNPGFLAGLAAAVHYLAQRAS